MRRSAHNTGVGLHRDYTKHNLAVREGWTLLYFDSQTINDEGKATIELVNEVLRQKTKERKGKKTPQRRENRRTTRSKAKKTS